LFAAHNPKSVSGEQLSAPDNAPIVERNARHYCGVIGPLGPLIEIEPPRQPCVSLGDEVVIYRLREHAPAGHSDIHRERDEKNGEGCSGAHCFNLVLGTYTYAGLVITPPVTG